MLLPVAIVSWDSSLPVRVITPVILVGCALALGASVLRYRLFDVDRIIGRSLAYASVTIIAVGVYASITVLLGTLAGRSWSSPWVVALSTLVAAAVFRRFCEASARSRIDGSTTTRSGPGCDSTPSSKVCVGDRAARPPPAGVVRGAAGPPAAAAALPAGLGGFVDVRGRPPTRPDLGVVRLERQGVPEAVVQFTEAGEPDRSRAGPRNSSSTRGWPAGGAFGGGANRRLDEFDQSRARIAESADEERRRIQRDLHDGAQQRLVTVGIALRGWRADCGSRDERRTRTSSTARSATSPPRSRSSRNLTSGFRRRSSTADRSGLAGARVASPIPVIVDAGTERVGRSVETAAYFVACEGLTNVIKHAEASVATLRAVCHHGSLFVSVADDGVGGATVRPGSGLAGLADRVAAVGGSSADRFRSSRHTADRGAAMRLMLVEDQALLREGLIGVFRDAGHDVVASAGGCDGLEGALPGCSRCGRPGRQASPDVHRRGCPGGRRPQVTPPTSGCCCSPSTSRRCTAWVWSGWRLRLPAQGPGAGCP